MKKLILNIANLFLPLLAMAQQNLVLNGDFEQYSSCPINFSTPNQYPKEIEKCIGWKAPTDGTSDYFNSCSLSSVVSTPSNFAGNQTPYNGNGYLGGFFASYTGGTGADGIMWWEYVQGQLTQTLEPGKAYKFSMEVSLAEYSDLVITEMGVYFSDDPISSPNSAALTVIPQIVFYEPNYFQDTTNWVHLETFYIANGTEKFLTIGNFRDNVTTDTMGRSNYDPIGYNYFYIDNVMLSDTSNAITIANVFTPNNDLNNDFYSIEGLNLKELIIFNRWGEEMAILNEDQPVWDGTVNGNPCSEGTYFYRAKFGNQTLSGFIELIR